MEETKVKPEEKEVVMEEGASPAETPVTETPVA